MQPPSEDPTNQSKQPKQPLTPSQSDWTIPPQSLPGSASPRNYPQERHPGEEGYYGIRPQLPSANYPAPYYPNPNDKPEQPKRRNPLTIVVLVLVVLVLILGATMALVLRRISSSPAVASSSPTQLTSSSPTANGATSTPLLPPTATPQTVATVASGTITENLQLTCGPNCNDPIQVTITTIQVDDANGNMVWNVSLKNVSGSSMGYGIDTFELLASGTQTQIPANFPQSSGTLTNSDPDSIQGTFAFVPTQNTTYTLTVVIEENPFMGPQITFDPAQITNL